MSTKDWNRSINWPSIDTKLWIFGFCVIGFFLRIFLLTNQSLWGDELHSIARAQAPLYQIAANLRGEFHLPLYFYSLHFWILLAGLGEFSVRYLSVFFGVLQIPLIYRLGSSLFDKRIGLGAAALATFSPTLIYYSQEVRMYSLLPTLALVSSWFAWQAAKSNRTHDWILYAIASAVGVYVHYAYLSVLLFQNIFFAPLALKMLRTGYAFAWKWIATQITLVLIFMPQVSFMLNEVSIYPAQVSTPPDLQSVLSRIPSALPTIWMGLITNLTMEWEKVFGLLVVTAILAIAGAFNAFWRGTYESHDIQPAFFTLAWILIPLATIVALQDPRVLHPRYVIFLAPAVFLFLAQGVEASFRLHRAFGIAGIGFLLLTFILGTHSFFFDSGFYRDDVRGTMAYLARATTPEDVIVTLEPPDFYKYYYSGPAPLTSVELNPERLARDLSEAARGKERLFLIQWLTPDPWGGLSFLLGKYGEVLGQEIFHKYRVIVYRLPPETNFQVAETWQPADLQFGEKLTLAQVAYGGHGLNGTSSPEEANASQTPAGQPAWVALRWRSLADLFKDYATVVILEDGQGHLLAQSDIALLNARRLKTAAWGAGEEAESFHLLQVPPGTPPGEYPLLVAVYDGQSLERLGAYSASGGFLGSLVRFGSVTVLRPPRPPDPEELPIPNKLLHDFGPLRLLGYDLPDSPLYPGGTLSLALWWQATDAPMVDYEVQLQVLDRDGNLLGEFKGPPVNGTYPTSQWMEGEVVRDFYDLRLNPEALTGQVYILLRILDTTSGTLVGEMQLATLTLQPGRPHLWERPRVELPLEAKYGDSILLLGYNLPSNRVKPGGSLSLTLYWQALGQPAQNYTVFTHLLDRSSKIWGQLDTPPLEGHAPTSEWLTGEYLIDPYLIPLDPNAPPGEHWLEFGLYDPQSGERLPIFSTSGEFLGDHLVLGPIQVMGQ